MALIMLVGYTILIIKNLTNKDNSNKINIGWILAIGILVQFSWEAVLLITGIRTMGMMPLIVNSLIETNMGLPYLFLIHFALSKKYKEDLKPK
jgi:hypothetical protein